MKTNTHRFRVALFAVLFFALLQTSCRAFSSGIKTNKKYDEKKMYTLTGKKIVSEKRTDIYTDQEFGFGFIVPESMRTLTEENVLEILPQSAALTFFTVYSQKLFPLLSSLNPQTLTEEEWLAFATDAQKYSFSAGFLFRLSTGEPAGEDAELLEYVTQNYSVCEKIAETEKNVYYYGYNTDYSAIDFSDDEKAKADIVIAELQDFKKNIFVFPPLPRDGGTAELGDSSADLSSFSVRTIDGKTVTQDLFSDYKVTMINIWATWCGPCVKEMPDLAKLHSSMLPANTNMISICTDAADDPEAAKKILNAAGAGFDTLIPNADLAEFVNTVSAIPTTVFVDSQGRFIGKRITGVPPRDPAAAYAQILEELSVR